MVLTIIICKTILLKYINAHLKIGVLAGIRPCGVIVLLAELFSSESKTQVYGHLHQFVQSNTEVANNISKYVYVQTRSNNNMVKV